MQYLAISEDLCQHIYLFVTDPALCSDKLVNKCAARSGSPHRMINHHTSSTEEEVEERAEKVMRKKREVEER